MEYVIEEIESSQLHGERGLVDTERLTYTVYNLEVGGGRGKSDRREGEGGMSERREGRRKREREKEGERERRGRGRGRGRGRR